MVGVDTDRRAGLYVRGRGRGRFERLLLEGRQPVVTRADLDHTATIV
jgi:hypothetical protein